MLVLVASVFHSQAAIMLLTLTLLRKRVLEINVFFFSFLKYISLRQNAKYLTYIFFLLELMEKKILQIASQVYALVYTVTFVYMF